MLILDAAVNGDVDGHEETRRFIANLSASATTETMTFLDAAWFFFRGDWGDPRLVDIDPGSVHRWVRVILEWARFELEGDAETALARAVELAETREIRFLAESLEARVTLANGDPLAASQRADAALQGLQTQCRIDYEACTWLPLAEWVLGQALSSIEGRDDEARAVLARAAERAPNTWIATSVTQ